MRKITFTTGLFIPLLLLATTAKPSKKEIIRYSDKVANWQIAHFEEFVNKSHKLSHEYWAWTNAAFYIGLWEIASITENDVYFSFLKEVAEKNHYKPGPDIFHADDISVCWLYFKLYEKYRQKEMIAPTLQQLDYILSNRQTGSLLFQRKGSKQRWSWCDAIFMAPPVYAKAASLFNNPRYLQFMNEELKTTYDTLYCKEENLFYRDTNYKPRREANGEKVFWSRGNGWVVAGLCRIIENIPSNHPSRIFYIDLYKEMIKKIVSLQHSNGYWSASMLDPTSYSTPEISATGFFTYALAWGINNNIIPSKKYKLATLKAWKALKGSVHEDGKVGWVQPIGSAPKQVTFDMTEVYGSGAFLLAASQLYKMK
jgi:rhamnogalacturonyl hydrolase YesR